MNDEYLKKLRELKAYGEANDVPNVPENIGQFLSMMIQINQAKNILEIGSANGYSTLWMAEAAKEVGGHIDTVEWSTKSFGELEKNIVDFEMDDVISPHLGDAMAIVPKLNKKYDFVFVDGMKRKYWEFWGVIEPMLNENAIIIYDDMVKFKDKTQVFEDNIKKVAGIDTVMIPDGTGDAIMLIYKR